MDSTKDALIEALALEIHCKGLNYANDKTPCDLCRRTAREVAPAVVEFVTEWLLRPGSCVPWLAKEWREEMGE